MGYFYVFPEDLGEMTYYQAIDMCKNVNSVKLHGYNDWRLPTMNELKVIYQNKSKLDGLVAGYYLSSDDYNSSYKQGVNFASGSVYTSQGYSYSYQGYIRLVRTDR